MQTGERYQIARQVCNEEKRKITKNDFILFPQPDKTCFEQQVVDLFFTIPVPNGTVYYEKGNVEEIDRWVDGEETTSTDGWIEKVHIHSKIFTMPFRKYTSQIFGPASIGVDLGTKNFMICYNIPKELEGITFATESEYATYFNS
jgi:transposase